MDCRWRRLLIITKGNTFPSLLLHLQTQTFGSLRIPTSAMNFPTPMLQPLLPYFAFKAPQFRCFYSLAREATTYTEMFTILETVDPMEDALENILPRLSPELVTSVIQDQPNQLLGFRFFIWAVKRKRLHNRVSHNLVIDMLMKDSGFELYWKTLEQLRECKLSIPSHAFLVLIKGYAKLGMAEKAVESFCRMKDFNCEPSGIIYNIILYVMVQKQVVLLALAVYNQMLKSSCSPDIATFNILIDGLCKSRKIDDALKMLDEMEQRGITPSEITYTIVISGLCKAKRINEAHRLFMKAKECNHGFIIYNALLDGYCKLGRINEAYALLCSFQKDGYVIGLKGYSCLIDSLFKAGRYDEAHGCYRKMVEEGIKLDTVFYTIMIQGLLKMGRTNDALELLDEMTDRGLTPDTYCYNAVIKGLCDLGLLDKAQSLHLQISKQDRFPDAFTYTILICGMCRNGLVGEAQQIFNEMEKLGCLPSVVTFNALIDGLCKSGQLEEAKMLFYNMELGRNPSLFLRLSQGSNRVIDSDSLKKLMEQLCESGLILKAYQILMKLAESGVVPDVTTYNILINGFCKAGNPKDAMKLFKDMKLKGLSPDSVTYGTLVDGFQRIGNEEDASLVFDLMLKDGQYSSAVYKSFMTWLCRKGKVSSALSCWLEYQGKLPGRDKESLKAFEDHFKNGKIDKLIQGLLELDFGLKEFDLAPYMILLIGLCQARRVDEAFTIFSVLKEWKINVTPPSCVKLIYGLCEKRNLDSAIDVFHYTLEKGFKLMPQIWNQLLKCLLSSHDKKNCALELISKMESAGYDLDANLYQTTKILLYSHLNTQWKRPLTYL
ncbi:pentatricopeptide repeat-containing protein At1g79540 [Ziziphus jujuba]|uniref:Pentatricopeptide repeat-containing protein At1g79540 n=1 Tax=Ziziphus jujuba TaxID=326968 RepID=A0ABM3I5Y7_ZIZJJ|nr:pentatricopeptide repeat-containing protein At1g79540 [Ziziphus jujuba]